MPWATMPEAAVDQDCRLGRFMDDIRTARHVARGIAKAIATPCEKGSQSHFRARCLAADASHYFGAFGLDRRAVKELQ